MQEVWEDVAGYEDYFSVSNLGRVQSKRSNKLLKYSRAGKDYLAIASKIGGRKGKNICLTIHRIVATAFLAPPSDELVTACAKEHWRKVIVRHRDGDKRNNVATNLEWGTSQDNSNDHWATDYAYDCALRGSTHGSSKLSDSDVALIRHVYVARHRDFGCRALALKYGMSHAQISNVVNNKSYK